MIALRDVRSVAVVGLLVLAWCALWGEVSVANVASGLLVAVVARWAGSSLGATPGAASGAASRADSTRGGIRIGPLVHLAWVVAVDLVVSTLTVVREVLTPTDHTDEAIIAVPLPDVGRRHLLLMFAAITLTPGTAVVAAESDAAIIYLHVLHADRRDEVVAHVLRLADLAERALPTGPAEEDAA